MKSSLRAWALTLSDQLIIHAFHLLLARSILALTDAKVEFGLIPHDHWFQPDWIDEEKASASRAKMAENNVIYGGTYHFVCSHTILYFMRVLQAVFRAYYPFVERPDYLISPSRYRNMCRYNSGVRLDSLLSRSAHLISHSVLLSTRASTKVQVLLEGRVGTDVYILRHQQADSVYSLSPDVTYFCDLDYDPFLVMQDQGKVYGRISHLK